MSDLIQLRPVLRRGSRGHPVPALQYLLRDRGHEVTVDGIFGPKTEAAVRDFQHAEQLKVDGVAGPKTWGAPVIVVASSDHRGSDHRTSPGGTASLGRGGTERAASV